MRKLLVCLGVLVPIMLAAVPTGNGWSWRTHGGTYGSHGIAPTVLERIINDPGVSQAARDDLNSSLIRVGAYKPDLFDSRAHVMTGAENRGAEWLLEAERAFEDGVWDNVSYFLGLASHYWGDVTCYAHHDNARAYFDNLFPDDPSTAYTSWNELASHLELQVKYYRPMDPALIVQDDGTPYDNLMHFLGKDKETTPEGAKENAEDNIYWFIDNTMPPSSSDIYEWMKGWWGDWIDSRKCGEENDYSAYHDGNIDNVHYGSKELLDMSTELVYSGWVYAIHEQNNVTYDRITWEQWRSREHREPNRYWYPSYAV
jgi:hypothetical protein